MDHQHYTTGQFAQKASVTARTLRFYDKVGLLSPSEHTEAGHRLYSDEDLWSLQQVLALKFLGFSLEEIKVCLQTDPERLQETLATQKAMMREKRKQLDAVVQAIEQAEASILDNGSLHQERGAHSSHTVSLLPTNHIGMHLLCFSQTNMPQSEHRWLASCGHSFTWHCILYCLVLRKCPL